MGGAVGWAGLWAGLRAVGGRGCGRCSFGVDWRWSQAGEFGLRSIGRI